MKKPLFEKVEVKKEYRLILNKISKTFKREKNNTNIISKIIDTIKDSKSNQYWSLQEISLSVKKGEIIGLIGQNGAGKSTILRIITGIYQSDKGSVVKNGKIIPVINLNVGLQDRLTVLDNIYLCSALLGLGFLETKSKVTDILEISELMQHKNTKLFQISEGSKKKLALSIAMMSYPDILLIDEMIEIGDLTFKKKVFCYLDNFKKNSGSAIIAGHDLELIEKYCSTVIWVENGRIKKSGPSKTIIAEYKKEYNY